MIEAGRNAGVDEFQLSNIAEAMDVKPEEASVPRPEFTEDQKAEIAELIPPTLPDESQAMLMAQLGIAARFHSDDADDWG